MLKVETVQFKLKFIIDSIYVQIVRSQNIMFFMHNHLWLQPLLGTLLVTCNNIIEWALCHVDALTTSHTCNLKLKYQVLIAKVLRFITINGASQVLNYERRWCTSTKESKYTLRMGLYIYSDISACTASIEI